MEQRPYERLSLSAQQLLREKGFDPQTQKLECTICCNAGMVMRDIPPYHEYCACLVGSVLRYLDSGRQDWHYAGPTLPKPPGHELFIRHSGWSLYSFTKLADEYLDYKRVTIELVRQLIEDNEVSFTQALRNTKSVTPGWVANLQGQLEKSMPGLYMFGDVGLGKSTLLSIIMTDLVKKGKRVRAIDWSGFISHVQRTYSNGDESRADAIAPYMDLDYLLIDDLGDPAKQRATDDRREILWLVLAARYNAGKRGLVITSNMDPARLRSYFGDRIADRVLEDCCVTKLAGIRLPSRKFT